MGTIAELSDNPQLARADALVKNALKIIQRYLEPVNGRVSKVNLRAALDLLGDVTKAFTEMDLAHYEAVEMLLDWASEDAGGTVVPMFVTDLLASLPAEGGSSQVVFETTEKMLAVVVFATGTHASPVADLYRNWEASAA